MYAWDEFLSSLSWYDCLGTQHHWQVVRVITMPASMGDRGRPKGKPRPTPSPT